MTSQSPSNVMQICCSTCSVILNSMVRQYTCSLNSIYHPHWLVECSHHCSHVRTPVHSPWLPGYTDVTHTIFVTLTMTGLFLDRLSCICACVYIYTCIHTHKFILCLKCLTFLFEIISHSQKELEIHWIPMAMQSLNIAILYNHNIIIKFYQEININNTHKGLYYYKTYKI